MVKRKRTTKKSKIKELKFPIIKLVTLNNKARKGKYYYIKLEKGQVPSYYKKQKGLKKEDYIETKKFGIVAKKKGAKKKRTIVDYLKKIKTQKKVEDIIKKGYTEYTINHAERLTPYGFRVAYMSLLTNKQKKFKGAVVKDKLLAEILSRPENVAKYKQRIEYQIDVLGQNEKKLATLISAHKGKTLEEIKAEVSKKVKIGMDIKGDGSPDFSKEFKEYVVIRKGTGKVESMRIKMIFRKG